MVSRRKKWTARKPKAKVRPIMQSTTRAIALHHSIVQEVYLQSDLDIGPFSVRFEEDTKAIIRKEFTHANRIEIGDINFEPSVLRRNLQ